MYVYIRYQEINWTLGHYSLYLPGNQLKYLPRKLLVNLYFFVVSGQKKKIKVYLFVFLCFLLSPWLCIPIFLSSGFVFVFYYTSISALSYVLFSPSTQDECSSIFHLISFSTPILYFLHPLAYFASAPIFHSKLTSPFIIFIYTQTCKKTLYLNIANQQNVKLSWLLLLLSFLNPPFLTSHTPPNSYNTPDT